MKEHTRNLVMALSGLAFLTIAASLQAQVYKTVDENGNVIYTDKKPSADSKPMDLPGLSIISPQVPVVGLQSGEQDAEKKVESLRDLRREFQDFTIVFPTQDQVFVGTGNQIGNVTWTTGGVLREGMAVTLFIDGVAQEPTTSRVVEMGPLERGTHVIGAELSLGQNRLIARATPVTFHVRQGSVNFPSRRAQGG